jgi:hypothetical protein
MNSSIDPLGLLIVGGLTMVVALLFRALSHGGTTPVLRKTFRVMTALMAAIVLWIVFVSFAG